MMKSVPPLDEVFSMAGMSLPSILGTKTAEPETEAEVVDDVEYVPAAVSNDDEIVAVIVAAIAMAESESLDTKFRVVSFKRK